MSARCRSSILAALVLIVGGCGSDPDPVGPVGSGTTDGGITTESTDATVPVATTPSATTTAAATTSAEPTTTPVTTTPVTTTPVTTTPVTTTTTTAVATTIDWDGPVVVDQVDLGLGSSSAASPSGISTVRWTGREGMPPATDLWFSADATTWKSIGAIDGVRLFSIVAGGPGYVAVGNEDTDVPGPPTPVGILPQTVPVVWTSADGSVWAPAPSIDNGPFPFGSMHDVAATTSGLVVVGDAVDAAGLRHPAVWTSFDGLAWSIRPGDPLGTIDEGFGLSVAAGDGGVVAIAGTFREHGPGSVLAWWSPDGTQWERTPGIESFEAGRGSPNGVVAFGSGFVMVGSDPLSPGSGRPVVWTSVDGRTWNDPAELPSIDFSFLSGLATDGSLLVAVGDSVDFAPDAGPASGGATMWTSNDAEHWVQVPPAVLDGDAILDGSIAQSAVHFDGEWVVLGTTWEHASEAGHSIIWYGRSHQGSDTTSGVRHPRPQGSDTAQGV